MLEQEDIGHEETGTNKEIEQVVDAWQGYLQAKLANRPDLQDGGITPQLVDIGTADPRTVRLSLVDTIAPELAALDLLEAKQPRVYVEGVKDVERGVPFDAIPMRDEEAFTEGLPSQLIDYFKKLRPTAFFTPCRGIK